MTHDVPDLTPDSDAAAMADALRSGLALRRSVEARTPGVDAARLRPLGDLEGLPPVAKPGLASPVIRFVRRVLRGFLRPWLAVQTTFNHEIADRLDESAAVVRDLHRRVPALETGLQDLDTRLRQLETPATPVTTAAAVVDADALQRAFIQSRLPPPRARIRLFGAARRLEDELAMLGYSVIPETSGVDAVVGIVPGDEEGALDIPTLCAGLDDHGRLILIVARPGVTANADVRLRTRLSPLTVTELLFAVDGMKGWRMMSAPSPDASMILVSAAWPHAAAG